MAAKSKSVKTAFRVYGPTDKLYQAPYQFLPINQSNIHEHNVRILGEVDKNKCGKGEYCPAVNVRVKMDDSTVNYFANTNLVARFSEDALHIMIKFCTNLKENKINADKLPALQDQIQWCNKHVKLAEDKIPNPSFNCTGFALGIKMFIPANLYLQLHDSSVDAIQNVRRFLVEVLDLFGSKDANIMGIISDLTKGTIRCFDNFDSFRGADIEPADNDVVLYFIDGFSQLLHGARWIEELTDEIPVNAWVSKLGNSYLVSHAHFDVFNTTEYGDEVCHVSIAAGSSNSVEL